MYSTEERDEDFVEFDVAELVSLSRVKKSEHLPFDMFSGFLKSYADYLNNNISTGNKDVILRFVMETGRNPVKFVFLPVVEERSIVGGIGLVGLIGYLQTSRYPLTYDFAQMTISPIPLPRTRAIMNSAHFIVFEHNGSSYIIFERNNNAPSLTKFTEYICKAWNIVDARGALEWCPIKHVYVRKDPEITLRHYRFVTGITISGGLKAARVLGTFQGMNIKEGLLSTNARQFTIEFSGRGRSINLTIDEVIDIYRRIVEHGGRNIVSRFTVKVKRLIGDKTIKINLLESILTLSRHVPWAKDDEGRELGSLDTIEAFKALVGLASEAKRILSGEELSPMRPKRSRTLLDYILKS